MPTANELLRDAVIDHQVDLSQYSAHVVRRMIGVLNRTDASLMAELVAALERLDAESFTVERLELLLQAVQRVNLEAYRALDRELTTELREFAAVESQVQRQMVIAAVPEPVRVAVTFTAVAPEAVYAAAMSRPFQGRLLREWASGIEADRMQRIRETIAEGFTSGRTVDQMVRQIRGTRAANYADGILEIDRRHAQAIVRTAVQHVAATTRDRMAQANADIVKGRQWLSTLDSRTSPPCRLRDKLRYTNDDRPRPIGHSVPWLSGPGRLHWNCRSTSTLVLKSLDEITGLSTGVDWPAGTRAAMDGQVAADTTYPEWFKRQSAARQDEIVGPTRGRLMREGKLPFDALYTPRGEYLTLDDLRRKHAGAFERAGV